MKLLLFFIAALGSTLAHAGLRPNDMQITQHVAEIQIRHLVEPVLDKYCHDECKLLGVNVSVDLATPDALAPGFDEMDVDRSTNLAPTAASIKLLIDEKVGPISRGKLTELLQQYLDTLDYPVKIDSIVEKFPEPIESASKVAELRDRITKKFQQTVNDLIQEFCPQRCLLADYNLQTELVNTEEAQYGASGEFMQEGDVAVRIKDIAATILMDESLSPDEQKNLLEMAKLKTNFFKNVDLSGRSMKFPDPMVAGSGGVFGQGRSLASEKNSKSEKNQLNSTTTNDSKNSSNTTSNNKTDSKNVFNTSTESKNAMNEQNTKQERFERIEKIERVESGDAVQKELQKFKVFGLIFACSILSLLIFLAMASYRPRQSSGLGGVTRVIQSLASDPVSTSAPSTYRPADPGLTGNADRNALVSKRYEIERLTDELMAVFAQQPKVAKAVFSRVLTEEGVEITADYISIFGESVVIDMLRDPSLQSDLAELMEYYAKNPVELTDDEKLELLRKLHNRTVAGKLVVLGNRSSNLFDFLSEMDGLQIYELVRTESMTVKSIVLTQCDPQKRAQVYSQLDEDTRMKLLTELSRIDYLPRDYIFNVSNALKRKRRDNPKLNTEALPGSEVLVSLLERTSPAMQHTVLKNLEVTSPDSARVVKSKLVSLDTLKFLRDGQLLEVILSLKHDELLQFLKGTTNDMRSAIFSKSPKELVSELEEELGNVSVQSREGYQAIERKVLNRMKIMANDGLVNLVEVNERMFAGSAGDGGFVDAGPAGGESTGTSGTMTNLKKVAGW